MDERRCIIGYVEDSGPDPSKYIFSRVCAWIKPDGSVCLSDLRAHFATSGTVYMHSSMYDLPQLRDYGAYECVDYSRDHSANWKVTYVRSDLCEVFSLPNVTSIRSLSLWLENQPAFKPHSVFQGTNDIYVHTGLGLFGPFILDHIGCIQPKNGHAMLYVNAPIIDLQNGISFVLTSSLIKGDQFTVNRQAAAKTLLSKLRKKGSIKWITRDNHGELAAALVSLTDAKEVDWVKEDLKEALDGWDRMDGLNDDVYTLLIQNPKTNAMLEEGWKQANTARIHQADSEVKALIDTKNQLETKIFQTQTDLLALEKSLEIESHRLAQVQKVLEESKGKAQTAFQEELLKIANNPTQLILLESILRPRDIAQSKNIPQLQGSPTVEHRVLPSFQQAIEENLSDIGLKKTSAIEVSCTISAALLCGQPISIVGTNADYLADVAASSIGDSQYLKLDTPAGLLEPYKWPATILESNSTVLIQSINRSAIDIVIGSLKQTILQQVNGIKSPNLCVFLTFLPFNHFSVHQSLPYGPIIDEKFIGFSNGVSHRQKAKGNIPLQIIAPDEVSDLLDLFKPIEVINEDLLTGLFLKNLTRVNSSLISMGIEHDVATQILFKYWILPRLEGENLSEVCATWISRDEFLKKHHTQHANLSDQSQD